MTAFNTNETNANAKASTKKPGFFSRMFNRTSKKEDQKLSFWGAAWRTGLIMLLVSAAVVGVILGLPYAVGYIAGLGLTAMWTTIWTVVVNILACMVTMGLSSIAGLELSKVYARRAATKAAEETAGAYAAA